MEVSINQQDFQLSENGPTLADVLPLLHIDQPDGIAMALNDTVIPRTEWQDTFLRQGDKVFVIRATQGG
jgi:sulfur carrier protein